MKDFKFIIASFILIMLITPAISVEMNAKVHHDEAGIASTSLPAVKATQGVQNLQVFRVLKTSTGEIEEIPAVDYICGVVAAEVPASYQPEALKAQAVAAFTYACYHRDYNITHPSAAAAIYGADLSDDYHHYEAYISKQDAQKKWGKDFDSNWKKISDAVNAVKNSIITYGGKPIDAEFFAVSSGATESSANVWGSSVPYLVPVSSVWDKVSSDYKSTVTIKQSDFKAEVEAKYKNSKFDRNPSNWLVVKNRSASGVVVTAQLCGKSLGGGDIRSLFNLKSSDFTENFKNGVFTFNVAGDGHDVGMSQYGAEYLALHGEKWDEIVKYYYKGVSVSNYIW
jgi:stage II sporulation protein D